MANIPPLLSSSPPPLDITDDNEDFIDVVPVNDYAFDDGEFTNCGADKSKPCIETISTQETNMFTNSVDEIPKFCENNNDKKDASVILSTNNADLEEKLVKDVTNYVYNAPINEIAELIDTPPPLHDIPNKAALSDDQKCTENGLEKEDIILEPVIENKGIDVIEVTDYDFKCVFNEISQLNNDESGSDCAGDEEFCAENEHVNRNAIQTITENVTVCENPDDVDDFDDFISAPEPDSKSTVPIFNANKENDVVRQCENKNSTISDPTVLEEKEILSDDNDKQSNEYSDFVFQEYESEVGKINDYETTQETDTRLALVQDYAKSSRESLKQENENDKPEEVNDLDDDFDDFDDFGDFSSFATNTVSKAPVPVSSTPTVLNLFKETVNLNKNADTDALILKLESVVTMMFPVTSDGELVEKSDLNSDELSVLPSLKDLETTNATTFHWRSSKAHNVTLKALSIDSRNIMYGSRWSNGMPRFAANLGCGPLEPLKPTPVTTSATQPAAVLTSDCTDIASDLPAAKFDWAGAGLVNPLDDHLVSPAQSQYIPNNNPPTDHLSFINFGAEKTLNEVNENLETKTKSPIENQIELPNKEVDLTTKDCSMEQLNSNKSDKFESSDSLEVTVKQSPGFSFHLPETHIFTSNILPPNENVFEEKAMPHDMIPGQFTEDSCNLPANIFTGGSSIEFTNTLNDKTVVDNNISLEKEKLSSDVLQLYSKSDFKDNNCMSDIKTIDSTVSQLNVTKIDTLDFKTVNTLSNDTQNIPNIETVIHDFDVFNSATSKSTTDFLSSANSQNNISFKSQLTMPKSNVSCPSSLGIFPEKVDDFDDFQSYDSSRASPAIQNSPTIQRRLELLPPQMLTPTILQPIVANSFTTSIDWSSADSHSNHVNNSTQKNATSDDSQTEWSDFVSINTVSKVNTSTNNKHSIDINAFKVPIKIDPFPVKNQQQPVKGNDVDDWSDFVSSTPVVHNISNGFKKVEPNDRWNRTAPQFSNWQTNSYHMPHSATHFSNPANSSVNSYGYSQQSMLSDFKNSMKYYKTDSANMQYKQTPAGKQKNAPMSNLAHNEIPSISSVPELGFVVPQPLLYLSNLPKK